ncbi:LytTR family DNA-binding domain-containing protein [Streptococcus hongkongensis]|nr:DNA-binding protein [Streptococcus uberis]
MKWLFKEDHEKEEIEIVITKESYDQEVATLVNYLQVFKAMKTDVLAVKTEDSIQLLKLADIIAVEVDGDYLDIMTSQGQYRTRERLYKLKDKLPVSHFIQVSKQSVINIKHLIRLEASFSGNMLAVLSQKHKVIISRRYVKELEKSLGL